MRGALGTQDGFAIALFQGWGGGVKYGWKMCSFNFSFQIKLIKSGYRWWWLWKPNCVCFTDNKIKGSEELRSLSQVSFNFLPNEGNVFRNCIMVIHNFRTVDETGYLLLVVVEKGGWAITKSRWPGSDNTVIKPELTGSRIPLLYNKNTVIKVNSEETVMSCEPLCQTRGMKLLHLSVTFDHWLSPWHDEWNQWSKQKGSGLLIKEVKFWKQPF
jgi:hypothetical protein